ncbi:MAG: diacylglycerol kinase family lipid kinase [Turneriella sp.]|nr:diacylglycerol kinase family lipid kinase [Turneriella sp.]
MVFIVNPQAGGGKSGREVRELEAQVAASFPNAKVVFTERRLHATELARAAVQTGAELVVAVGGDGTISEVAGGFFDEKGKPLKPLKQAPALGIVPAGSGSDYARTLGIPRSAALALQLLRNPRTRTVDVGLVEFTTLDGQKARRIFVNIADIGIGGEVVDILEKQGKKLGAFLSYQLATLRGLIAYKNKELEITLDKKHRFQGVFNGVIVAIGQYFGSGMKIAPQAAPDDGYFDVVLLGDLSKWELITKMQKVRTGEHVLDPKITVYRAKEVAVVSRERALLDCDGEMPGQCPAQFSILPAALKVVCPP